MENIQKLYLLEVIRRYGSWCAVRSSLSICTWPHTQAPFKVGVRPETPTPRCISMVKEQAIKWP